jgi:hypothetical protein
MSKVHDTSKVKVVRNRESTEVWNKNKAGKTTKEGYSRYDKKTGNTSDYLGNKK